MSSSTRLLLLLPRVDDCPWQQQNDHTQLVTILQVYLANGSIAIDYQHPEYGTVSRSIESFIKKFEMQAECSEGECERCCFDVHVISTVGQDSNNNNNSSNA
jgi:hypothetical protein